jgi:hypothetical protein
MKYKTNIIENIIMNSNSMIKINKNQLTIKNCNFGLNSRITIKGNKK